MDDAQFNCIFATRIYLIEFQMIFLSLCPAGPNSCGGNGSTLSDDESESVSRETSPCSESPQPAPLHDNDTPPPPPQDQSTTVDPIPDPAPAQAITEPTSNINERVSLEGIRSDWSSTDHGSPPPLTLSNLQKQHLNLRIKAKASTYPSTPLRGDEVKRRGRCV